MSDLVTLESADGARALVHPQGAHVTQWWPAGAAESRLFLSEKAVFAPGVAIRGGVPVIFPQFAAEGPLSKHGFARTSVWTLQHEQPGEAMFALEDTEATRELWPHAFAARLTVGATGRTLRLQLEVENTGAAALSFTAALHSYLAVADVASIRIAGLQGCHFRDTANGGRAAQQTEDQLRIVGEVDRIYFDTPATLMLEEPTRTLRLTQAGFTDTVVWNPGATASVAIKDLAAEDYQRFVCIEAATIQTPVTLAPGARWRGSQTIVAA